MDEAHSMISNNSKLAVSVPLTSIENHVMNIQGAFNKIITYQNGSSVSKLYYILLDNGAKRIVNVNSLVGKGVNLLRIIFP